MTDDDSTGRIYYLDASALTKLVTHEDDSAAVIDFVWHPTHSPRYTTSLCFAEALGVLKAKRFYRKQQSITQDEYETATAMLVAHVRSPGINIEPIDVFQPGVLHDALALSGKYNLDVSDTLQIVALRRCRIVNATLITADRCLAKAARAELAHELICVWTPPPPSV